MISKYSWWKINETYNDATFRTFIIVDEKLMEKMTIPHLDSDVFLSSLPKQIDSSVSPLSFGNWLKANSNRAFSKLKPLHVLVSGSLLVGEVKSFTVRKAIK